MHQGAVTGAQREVATLRTIARYQHEGKTITNQGLYNSARVPVQLAMLHFFGLMGEATEQETWAKATGGDDKKVLPREHTTLHEEQGLTIKGAPDFEDPAFLELIEQHGPRIGCPASLIPGYLRDVHHDTVETGLLLPNDVA